MTRSTMSRNRITVTLVAVAIVLVHHVTSLEYVQDAPTAAASVQRKPSALTNPHAPDKIQGKGAKCSAERVKNDFSTIDYAILGGMLVISCGIGIVIGFFGEEQTTGEDFLLGGSSMKTLPMAMSLGASFITAIELLGNPAEMYTNGTQFWMICVAFVAIVPLTSRLYLPVFMSLRLTSSYEYFNLRFSSRVQYLASGLYILQMTLYTSVAVYAPALALANVTGLNVYMAVTVVYVVCIFYASQGGMKAVIITDTFQAVVLVLSIVMIMFIGEIYVGDTGLIWSTNDSTGRIEFFNLTFDPTIQHGFWSVVIGGTFYWLTMFCANQASIQKYLSVEKISQVRIALWISCFGLIVIYTVNFLTGMIMLTSWRDCDPLKRGEIHSKDELFPLYVLSVMGHLKGVSGLFVAGIFAASLGTVASALNSLAAVTMKDFINGAFNYQVDPANGASFARWISICFGIISFALVFVVEKLGSIMQVAICFNGMVGGVTLGLFSLGMFFPWANSKGAISGAIVSTCLVLYMAVGAQISIANGMIPSTEKYTSVEKCACFNATLNVTPVTNESTDVPFLFRVSYLWYSMIGCVLTFGVGVCVSYVTGSQDPKKLDPRLISPAMHMFYGCFSQDMKDRLGLPLKTPVVNERKVSGIVNPALNMSDERLEKGGNEKSVSRL